MSIQLPRFLEAFKPTHVSLDLGALRGSGTATVAGPTPVTDVFINGEDYLPEADREEVYGGPPEDPTGGGAVATVRRGSRGESVRRLQQQLRAAGFNPGAADGIFGPNTEKAVRDFQKAKGLTVDGVAGPQTWGALGEKKEVNTVGVRKLQLELKQAGFNPGGIDGEFGPNTEKAVKAFQRAKGLEVDGIVGPKTWEALGVKSNRILRRKAPGSTGSTGSVNTPDGPMVYRQGKLISPKIAGKFDQMAAAASRAGISLQINNSYRSYAEQVVLWNRYGRDPARVARPGHSNHQTGTAIDFVNTPGAYAWLKANAHRYGLHNYPPEPWHYSLTGR